MGHSRSHHPYSTRRRHSFLTTKASSPDKTNYIYGKVFNRGPNTARNVRLAVTLVNYAGTDFLYPQDWHPVDWDSSFLTDSRVFLGESDPVNISANKEVILRPVHGQRISRTAFS